MLKFLAIIFLLGLNFWLGTTVAISLVSWFTDITPPSFWASAGLLLTIRFIARGTQVNDYTTKGTDTVLLHLAQTFALGLVLVIGYLISLGVSA